MIIFWQNYTASYVESHDYLAPGIVSMSAEQMAAIAAIAAGPPKHEGLLRTVGRFMR